MINTPVTRLFRLSHPADSFSCFVSVPALEFDRHSIDSFGRHQLQQMGIFTVLLLVVFDKSVQLHQSSQSILCLFSLLIAVPKDQITDTMTRFSRKCWIRISYLIWALETITKQVCVSLFLSTINVTFVFTCVVLGFFNYLKNGKKCILTVRSF